MVNPLATSRTRLGAPCPGLTEKKKMLPWVVVVRKQSGSELQNDQGNPRPVKDDFTLFSKVDGDLATHIRLDLPVAPIRPIRMTHDHARGKNAVEAGHQSSLPEESMKSKNDLVALVGSRICHDLISPLGAIGNGVELLGLTGLSMTPELSLIAESVENAHARIRFFRVAYGAAVQGQMISRAEITGTLAAVARAGRLSYFWEVEGEQPRPEVRAIFLLLQCFETAMPFGGEIHIRRYGQGWEVEAQSARFSIDRGLWAGLQQGQGHVSADAARVQFALLPDALAELGKTLRVSIRPDRIVAVL